MGQAADVGRRLEQDVAEFFRAHGYEVRRNEVLEGRSGGRHEVDVLARKADPLTTFTVAVECKAWRDPIEKDVVSKLHYVRSDLGLDKAIVVSLAGWRVGAQHAADELGIALWGPAQLASFLGDRAFAGLRIPEASASSRGIPFSASAGHAERQVRWSGMGRLQLRVVETLRWFGPVWLPAHAVRLTVASEDVGRFRPRLRSVGLENLYDAVGGTFLGAAPPRWQEIGLDARAVLPVAVRDTAVHGQLRRAVDDYCRVSTPAAVERHERRLDDLGLPVPCSSVGIERTELVHLPFHLGVLEGRAGQRAVAVAGDTGRPDEHVSRLLTAHLGLVLGRLEI
jgi:Holliday junction resolvase